MGHSQWPCLCAVVRANEEGQWPWAGPMPMATGQARPSTAKHDWQSTARRWQQPACLGTLCRDGCIDGRGANVRLDITPGLPHDICGGVTLMGQIIFGQIFLKFRGRWHPWTLTSIPEFILHPWSQNRLREILLPPARNLKFRISENLLGLKFAGSRNSCNHTERCDLST